MSTQLCVCLNKVALLRSSRGGGIPDLVTVVDALARGGCKAVLVHCWPDGRHIRPQDLSALASAERITDRTVEFYIGSDLRPEIIDFVQGTESVRSLVVTPFNAEHLTTRRGFSETDDHAALAAAVATLGSGRVCVFADPEPSSVRLAAAAGAWAVQLNCQTYVENWGKEGEEAALAAIARAADLARSNGLEVHAAHDLNAHHLPALVNAARPTQISVGHSFLSEALLAGVSNVLPQFLKAATPGAG